MFAKGQTVIQLMEQLAPKYLAEPEDKIGLQVGTLAKDIRKILVSLDVTVDVVEEAIREQADLIIAHHAVIFRPLKNLQTDTPAGKLYEKLIKNDIAVYIAHTNLDSASGGINDLMAEALGLEDVGLLDEGYTERLKKLVVFVPETHAENVRQAIFQAGAGSIGAYSHCSFNAEGTGTFLPGEGTEPFIGQAGMLERVPEIRVETVVPESAVRQVVQAMLKAHPYEEAAYDLYPLEREGRKLGLGRVGRLPEAITLDEFAERVKQALDVPFVRVVGQGDRSVRKIAVLGGQGGKYVRNALFAGADVYVTGDMDYHTAHDALAAGLSLIDPGHNSEKIMKQSVADYMNEQLKRKKYDTVAIPSTVDTEIFRLR